MMESVYYCANCGQRSSMYGHYVPASNAFSCEKKETKGMSYVSENAAMPEPNEWDMIDRGFGIIHNMLDKLGIAYEHSARGELDGAEYEIRKLRKDYPGKDRRFG